MSDRVDPFLEAYEVDASRRSNGLSLPPCATEKATHVPVVTAKPAQAETTPKPAGTLKSVPAESPPTIRLGNKSCSLYDLETINAFLKYCGLICRESTPRDKLLRRVIHNLSQRESFFYAVGSGSSKEHKLKGALDAAGLVEWFKQPYENGGRGKSWMRPTPLFSNIITRPCQLKQGDGHIPYFRDDVTTKELAELNAFLSGFDVQAPHVDLNALFRFNYVPHESGAIRQRLIHPLHNIKKLLRSEVTINGEPVVRMDVKSCHPQIILSLQGLPMDYSPYDLDPDFKYAEDLVAATKLMVQMMLNNKNERSARSAFQSCEDVKEAHRRAVLTRYPSYTDFMKAVANHNPLLADWFYSARHAELMNLDGSIMFLFHQKMMAEGIPSLSIHDEYLVRRRDKDIAERLYAEAWQKVTGSSIVPIVLEVEM
jgi:hypothetical protein